MMAMMAGLQPMMAPSMMGMAVGSMVGASPRARSASTTCRSRAPSARSLLVGQTIDAFAAEWEIPLDEMRLWVLAHELSGHRAVLDRRTSATRCADLVRAHVGGFRPDPSAVADKLGVASTPTRATRCRRCSRRSATPRCCSAP